MGMPKYKNGFALTLHEDVLEQPLHWKKPRIIFTASMSDMFHEKIPDAFIMKVFAVMRKADWHIYQILTKRSKRILEMNPNLSWASNI
jgi:protein gp37